MKCQHSTEQEKVKEKYGDLKKKKLFPYEKKKKEFSVVEANKCKSL